MANFPIPTSGTAWASGGISGRVGVKSMKRSAKRSRFTKKPWESRNWIPYMGNFNQSWQDESQASGDLVLGTCSDKKRIVDFAPHLMDETTLMPTRTGTVATEGAWKLHRIQGHVHFDGQLYEDAQYLIDATRMQNGNFLRVWYSWQKERTTTQGYEITVDDMGVGPGVLGDVQQLQSRHLLSWGWVDWTRPKMNANGSMTGEEKGDRTFIIPNPRLPPGGLKLGIGDTLTLICRASYGLGMGRDLSGDYTNSVPLPIALRFQPFMRFLVSA